jgi:hypothetical protein
MHSKTPSMERASEIASITEFVLKEATLRAAPNDISRYPSVKNLRKFQKKYDIIIGEIHSFIFSHLIKTYAHTNISREKNDNNNDKIREAQFSKNKGDSMPLSMNLAL